MHLYPIHLPNPKPTMNKPNIHDIIDLAYQIEQTRDPDIKAELKKYLLYLINTCYDIQSKDIKPYQTYTGCTVCGLNGMSGYVCYRSDCPTRITSTL